MQALWRTIRNPSDQIAHVALRVLGKFGGGNRKMMIEPQELTYNDTEDEGPAIAVYFSDHKSAVSISVKRVIETAFNALKSSSTEPGFYRKQCWEVIKCFLVASLQLDYLPGTLLKLFSHPFFREGSIAGIAGPVYKCHDSQARNVHQVRLILFWLKEDILAFFFSIFIFSVHFPGLSSSGLLVKQLDGFFDKHSCSGVFGR